MNVNQLRMLEWLEFYKRISEMDEKPPIEYMEYDYLIDEWLQNYINKQKQLAKNPKFAHKRDQKNVVRFSD